MVLPRESRSTLRPCALTSDSLLGSLSELSYFALLARDLSTLPPEHWTEFGRLHREAGKTTMGLYKAIARQKHPGGQSLTT